MEKIRQEAIEDKGGRKGSKLVFRYLPYWPLFAALFAICVGLAWVYLHFTTPLYQSSAKILIKDEKKGAEDTKAFDDLNLLSTKKIIENEMEVIQSNTLLTNVVEELRLYAPLYRKEGLKKISAYISSPVAIKLEDTLWPGDVKDIRYTVNRERSQVSIDGAIYPIGTAVTTPYGRLRFISNPRWDRQIVAGDYFFSLEHPQAVIMSLTKRLKISTANKLSSIINLTFLDEVPERANDVLNTLLRDYNKALIDDKNVLASNTLHFIEERLVNVQRDLDSIEHRVQDFKAQRDAVDIDAQGKLYLQNVSLNDQKLADINMQLAALNQVEIYVRSKNNAGGIVPSTLGVSDPVLTQLVDKLYSTELEYENLKKTTAENNPILLSASDRIEKIKPAILENVVNQRNGLEASRNNLASTNNTYSSVLQSMPAKQRQLIDISRSQSIKNEIYTFLLQKKEETALSYAATVSDSRIVDKALSSDKPVSPRRLLIYLLSALVALIAGFGIVYSKEHLRQKVMFRYEIEALTTRPVVGEITREHSRDPIVIGDNRKTFIAEQFRKLRMSLNFMGINATRKRILITSSISGEGKSFVSVNLALTLALAGKKVALLDFDLNNPSLNDKLHINDRMGIADYLEGKVEPDDIICPTDLHPNLFFLPTGELPVNPSELMMNGRAELLLNHLDGLFDYLVVDTAPVSPVTDAYILSPYCDATLFVVRHGYTPKIFIERLDENNRINHLTNMAIVFNSVTARGFGSKNYGYGYGYGYIYRNKEDAGRYVSDKPMRRGLKKIK